MVSNNNRYLLLLFMDDIHNKKQKIKQRLFILPRPYRTGNNLKKKNTPFLGAQGRSET